MSPRHFSSSPSRLVEAREMKALQQNHTKLEGAGTHWV